MTDTRYGRLLVIGESTGGKHAKVPVRCDCGAEKVVRMDHLRHGKTTSCGCALRDFVHAVLRKHGHRRGGAAGEKPSAEYTCWSNMKARCFNSTARDWENYGGRGITVCDRWQGETGFERFLADMGPKPSSRHTIDRIDSDGDYEPANCHWALPSEQARNRRSNRQVTAFGRTMLAIEWAEETGLSPKLICERLDEGWRPERAVSQVHGGRGRRAGVDLRVLGEDGGR